MGTLGRRRGAAGSRHTLVLAAALTLLVPVAVGCSHTQTVRLQPSTVEAGAGLRPIAGIQTNAVSWYLLFVPIPGGVDLDRVVNRMLIVAAKTMGADKVAQLRFEATPNGGVWALRKLFLWRSASAHDIAVQITESPPDPGADEGPEPAPANDPSH